MTIVLSLIAVLIAARHMGRGRFGRRGRPRASASRELYERRLRGGPSG